MPSDMELFDRWCADDLRAGNELFERHFQSMQRFFDRKIENDSHDLIQETFLACIKSRTQFRKCSSFRTYLFGIARITLLSYWRKQRRDLATINFEQSSVMDLRTSIGTQIVRQDERGQLLIALAKLPVDSQSLLELYYWHELDAKELSDIFGVEVPTIRSRLFRARSVLRKHLEEVGVYTSDTSDDKNRTQKEASHNESVGCLVKRHGFNSREPGHKKK